MMNYTQYAEEWLQLAHNERLDEPFVREGSHMFLDTQFLKTLQKVMKDREKKKYYYMLTFTLKEGSSSEKAHEYILRVPERKPLQVIRCDYVNEKTKKGVDHWHMSLITTKALKKDRFSYYEQKFGHLDISKNKAQQYDEMVEYMTKSDEIIKLK